jgi:iron complex transport system substrate-binding protein
LRFYKQLDKRIEKRSLPTPGNWESVSIENVLALKPDLVIIWSHQTDVIEAIEKLGIPVFGVFITKEQDIYHEMFSFGKLTDSEKRAEEIVSFTKQERELILSKTSVIPLDKRPKVFFMWAQGLTETSCAGSMVNELIKMAGGRNICEHIDQEHVSLQLEYLVKANPDVIVMWHNDHLDPKDLIKDPRLKNIRAIKEERVYELPGVFTNDLWTLKFILAVHRLARWLHPNLFETEMQTVEKRILHFFYGSDLGGHF